MPAPVNGRKACSKCRVEKDVSEFHKDRRRKDGLKLWCKQCKHTSWAKWRRINREKQAAQQRTWMQRNQERWLTPNAPSPFTATKKTCSACKEEHPRVAAFWYPDSTKRDGLDSRCVECWNDKSIGAMKSIRPEAEALAAMIESYSILDARRTELAWEIHESLRGRAACRVSTRLEHLVAVHVDADVREETLPLIAEALLCA